MTAAGRGWRRAAAVLAVLAAGCERPRDAGSPQATGVAAQAEQYGGQVARNGGEVGEPGLDLDPVQVALAYHKATGEPLDLRAAAERSDAVGRAAPGDRPGALAAETTRLRALADAADPAAVHLLRVSDHITAYDAARGEFSIQLLTPGQYVPVPAFGQWYQLRFANAEPARAIPMPRDEARAFDGMLERMGRRVTHELRFRIVGGDPAGALVGQRVVRAEILSSRLLDDAGRVVFTPRVAPLRSALPPEGHTAPPREG